MIKVQTLKQLFLLGIILGIGYLIAVNITFMLDAIMGAIILALLSTKPVEKLEKRGIKTSVAEWIFFFGSMLIIIVPLASLILIVKGQIPGIIDFATNYSKSLEIIGSKVNEKTGIDLFNPDLLKSIAVKVSEIVPKILNSTLDLVTTLGIMYFLLYYFIKEGESMKRAFWSIVPVNKENRDNLSSLIYDSVVSNALMMPLVALCQAVLAYISYLIVGVDNSLIWFLATFFISMLPFFGAGLVYIPLGVVLIFSGNQLGGGFILLWGLVVVSFSDNFLRMFMAKKFDDTHPLITFIGVLVGLNVFGFLGIIYGPLLISLLIILIRIYGNEYINSNISVEVPTSPDDKKD